jgi:hypothetical protein
VIPGPSYRIGYPSVDPIMIVPKLIFKIGYPSLSTNGTPAPPE